MAVDFDPLVGIECAQAGLAALDVFSEWKSVYVDFSGKLQRAQID